MTCRLCGGKSAPFSVRGAMYAECGDCGYIGIEQARIPTPAAEEARYRLHRNSYDDPAYRAWIEQYLDIVVPFMAEGASVLDFGSGPEPVPARLLTERGFEPSIYDPYFAPGDSWRSRQWDAILVHEVAEHLARPGETMAMLAGLLAPGGALCIRTRFPPVGREAFARWAYRMDSTHVGFFPERCLRLLSARLGLEPALLESPDRVVLLKPRIVGSDFKSGAWPAILNR